MSHIKKKIFALFITFVMVMLALSACSDPVPAENTAEATEQTKEILQDPIASYVEKEDKQYIVFAEDQLAELKQDINQSNRADYPEFDTLSEMKAYIKAGDYTDSEVLSFLRGGAINEADQLEVFNIEKLHDIQTPSNMEIEGYAWEGNAYYIELKGDPMRGFAYVMDREGYEFKLQEEEFFFQQQNVEVVSDEQIEDRNARERCFKSAVAEGRTVSYTLENNGNTMLVIEDYCHKRYNGDTYKVSETDPYTVEIIGKNGDAYFWVCILDIEERPSVEWLSSFGIVDYVEERTEAAVK